MKYEWKRISMLLEEACDIAKGLYAESLVSQSEDKVTMICECEDALAEIETALESASGLSESWLYEND